jgi:serine/threonine protein kinase
LSISRYEEEFQELSEVASGEFGAVKLARHRLDGSDYAVKVNKTKLRAGSYEEKKALNEVFAHATLNSHKHVVRYYNRWVEEGQVYIQNEFCLPGKFE